MTMIIAIANQKGGVGKTTSAISISSELALSGRKVLLMDLDPQGSATSGLGVEKNEEGSDLYDMFFSKVPLREIVRSTQIDNLSIIPASKDLISLELELGKTPGRELILKSELTQFARSFDYVFIDCPPSSGLISLNALGASDGILIPLQAEYYALEGLSALMSTIEFVRQTFNPTIKVLGVFITMYDARTNLSSQVEREARSHFHELLFESKIPRNIKISESPSHGLPICLYDKESSGARAYAALSKEIDARCYGVDNGPNIAANG